MNMSISTIRFFVIFLNETGWNILPAVWRVFCVAFETVSRLLPMLNIKIYRFLPETNMVQKNSSFVPRLSHWVKRGSSLRFVTFHVCLNIVYVYFYIIYYSKLKKKNVLMMSSFLTCTLYTKCISFVLITSFSVC